MPNLRTSGTIAVQLVLTAVMALVIGLHAAVGGSVHRSAFSQAFAQYRQNPTAENERAFREQQQLLYRDQNRFGAGVAVVSFMVLSAGVFLSRWIWRVTTKTVAISLALMLFFGVMTAAITSTTGHAYVHGVVYRSTWNMFPQVLYGMAVGLAVAVMVFRKRRDPSTAA